MQAQPDTPTLDWREALELARKARRCGARCKHSKLPCKNPAVRGRRVCRMHGAWGGAPRNERNGAYRHGRYTIEEQERRRQFRQEMRDLRALLRELDEE